MRKSFFTIMDTKRTMATMGSKNKNQYGKSLFFTNIGLLALLVLFQPNNTCAGTTSGAAWLGLPTDASSAALAGAVGAWNQGVDSLGVNPAGLAETKDTEAAFTHAFWAQGVSQEHLGLSHAFNPKFSLALSFDYVGFGSIDGYAVNTGGVPVANGKIDPNAMNLGVGCGIRLSKLFSLGAEATMVRENLTGTAGSTEAGDLGVLLHSRGFKVGLSVGNFGGTVNGAALPMMAFLSASYRMVLAKPTKKMKDISLQELGFMAQGDWGVKDSTQSTLGVGTEYSYAGTLALRVGYRAEKYGALTGLKGLTMGVGVKVRKMDLSYALVTLGDFGKSSLLTLAMGF